MALVALSVAACNGGGFGGVPESMSMPPTFTTPPTPAQAKYESLPTCRQVEQKVPGLPPFRSGNDKPGPSADVLTGCEFQRIPDWPRVSLTARVWRNDPGDIKYPADDGAAEDVKVGEQARWQTPKDKDSCYLMILDENAVLILENKPADKPGPRSETCRGPLRELATTFYDAVQP